MQIIKKLINYFSDYPEKEVSMHLKFWDVEI